MRRQTLDKLGVHPSASATTLAAQRRRPAPAARPAPRRPDPAAASTTTYHDFIAKVAQARKTTPEKIDAIAQGRVWTGAQAKERGLVDRIGLFGDALRSAATRAKLGDKPRVVYIEREPGAFARFVEHAQCRGRAASSAPRSTQLHRRGLGVAAALVRGDGRELGWVADIAERRKPFAAVVHCLCGGPN